MKKRMFLSTILMTLVLLVAVTTSTFAWYVAQLDNSKATFTLATMKNNTSTTQMSSIVEVIELNGAQALTLSGTPSESNGQTVTNYSWSAAEGTKTNKFLPVVSRTEATAEAIGRTTANVAALTNEAGVSNQFYSFVHDGTSNFTLDQNTKGLAALKITLTIGANGAASDQLLSIYIKPTMEENGVAATQWSYAYTFTQNSVYTSNSAEVPTAYTTSEAAGKAHQFINDQQYLLAGFCAPKATTLEITLVIWLNGCAVVNAETAKAAGTSFEIGLIPFVNGHQVNTKAATTCTINNTPVAA